MFSRLTIRSLLSGLIFLLLFQASFATGAMDWAERPATETISICTVEGSRSITIHQSQEGERHSSHCHCNCAPCGGVAMATIPPQVLTQPQLLLHHARPKLESQNVVLPSPHYSHPPAHAPPVLS